MKVFKAPANYIEPGSSAGRVRGGHDEAGARWVTSVDTASWGSTWQVRAADLLAGAGAPPLRWRAPQGRIRQKPRGEEGLGGGNL